MQTILVAAIHVEDVLVATASKIQSGNAVPQVGSTWVSASITGPDGTAHSGLKGRVTRIAYGRNDETPSVVEFKTSLSVAEFSPAYVAALKSAGWHIDPAAEH